MVASDMSSNSCCTSVCADAVLPAMRSRSTFSFVSVDMHCSPKTLRPFLLGIGPFCKGLINIEEARPFLVAVY